MHIQKPLFNLGTCKHKKTEPTLPRAEYFLFKEKDCTDHIGPKKYAFSKMFIGNY